MSKTTGIVIPTHEDHRKHRAHQAELRKMAEQITELDAQYRADTGPHTDEQVQDLVFDLAVQLADAVLHGPY